MLTRNSTEKIELATGKTVHVPKCKIFFHPWKGKPVKYTYGGKAVLRFRGKPLFAELVVLAMLKREGWNGVWVDSYRRKYRIGMFHTKEPIEVGSRSGEIRKLRWSYVDLDSILDSINVPGAICKNGKDRIISMTAELEEIIERRRQAKVPGCDLVFHHNGKRITSYAKAWKTACVINGLGAFYCRDCRDDQGQYVAVLDAKKTCLRCNRYWREPKYIGRIFHDFRRSAAHELWKAGNSQEECMEITGHSSTSMFKRYADLFSDAEKKARQQATQQKRREWKAAQSANVIAMPKRAVQ